MDETGLHPSMVIDSPGDTHPTVVDGFQASPQRTPKQARLARLVRAKESLQARLSGRERMSSPNWTLVLLAVLACWTTMTAATPTSYHSLLRRQDPADQDCQLYQDEAAHATFDRVCEVCHEMFRHQDPNFRAKCRSECYENETFVLCLNVFSRNVEVGLSNAVKRSL